MSFEQGHECSSQRMACAKGLLSPVNFNSKGFEMFKKKKKKDNTKLQKCSDGRAGEMTLLKSYFVTQA